MVAEFQMDGLFSEETYLNHSGLGYQDLTELTICLRYNINYFRGGFENALYVYSTWYDDNTLSSFLYQAEGEKLMMRICKLVDSEGKDKCHISHGIGLKPQQVWHHMCILLTSNESDEGKFMIWTLQLYFDGKKISEKG